MSLVVRFMGVVLVIALLAAGAASMIATEAVETARPGVAQRAASAFAPLPPINAQSAQSLIERSPFVPTRAAFDRQLALAPPPTPVNVQLTGISSVGGELRASLRVDGQSITVKKGDQTPIGAVTAIEASAVVIEGATSQRFEMFKQ